jgi:anhydro-N-acetylmuramic acid kinase
VDYALFAGRDGLSRAIQNIGGIANVTFLAAEPDLDRVISFDTGPGNMVIDRLTVHVTAGAELFDEHGGRAAQGAVDAGLLERMLQHPYLQLEPPKTSRGPEEFGDEFLETILDVAAASGISESDLFATVTQYTAECMALHYERWFPHLPDEVVLTGGGAHNKEIVRRLQERLPACRVRLHDEFGVPGDAREATTWAVLADETVRGNPGNIPSATGASGRALLGKIVVPSRLAGRFRAGQGEQRLANV